jgi:uncharacterized protein YihD (DUF1040 family)
LTASTYNAIGNIEAERKSGRFTPEQFRAFQTQSLAQLKKNVIRGGESSELERQQFNLEQLRRPFEVEQAKMALPEASLNAGQTELARRRYLADLSGGHGANNVNRMLDEAQAVVAREKADKEKQAALTDQMTQKEAEDLTRKANQTPYEQLQTAAKRAGLDEEIAKVNDRLIEVTSKMSDAAAKIKFEGLAAAVDDATAALNAIAQYGVGQVGDVKTPDAKKATSTGKPAHEGGAGPSFNIAIAPNATMTEKDIDRWMPAIREKLCKLAAQSGGRG